MPERGDVSPAHRSRIRIGFGPEPQQVGDGPPGETPGAQPADCNFTMRGVKSLADDLVVRDGRVNSRVALLLRAIERNPSTSRFFHRECLTALSPHSLHLPGRRRREGVGPGWPSPPGDGALAGRCSSPGSLTLPIHGGRVLGATRGQALSYRGRPLSGLATFSPTFDVAPRERGR